MSRTRPRTKLLAPTGQGRAEVIIRCPRRLERMLSQEFAEFQLPPVQPFQGGVQGLWTFEEAELACFASRIASRRLERHLSSPRSQRTATTGFFYHVQAA